MLTIASTTLVGADHYAGYVSDFGRQPVTISTALILQGFWYSGTILLILGAHELGHYLACRYYQVDASLPFFIPMPLVLTGTLGAFIRIREPIPTKRMLFDIGIAGPLAGFVFAVPALFIGIAMSPVVRVPDRPRRDFNLGEPLLFRAATWLTWGSIPDGYSVNLHPMAFAAWFGLLATALNLFPIGQLDGGHISYAVLGRRSTTVTLGVDLRRDRPDVLLDELARLDVPAGRDDARHGAAPSAHHRRRHPARPRRASGWRVRGAA